MLRKLLMILGICGSACLLCGGTASQAAQLKAASDLQISSIVISKNCEEANLPEKIKESLDLPQCPHAKDQQLIQVTVENSSRRAQQVGLEVELRRNGALVKDAFPREVYKVPSMDKIRILFTYIIPDEGGKFDINALVWDLQFKKILQRSDPGVDRQFNVPNVQEIQAEEERKKQETAIAEAKKAPPKLEFDMADLRWGEVRIIPQHVLRGEAFRLRMLLMNVGGDIVQDIKAKVEYFNIRLPLRKTLIAEPEVAVMAPGEAVTFELEYKIPEDQLLGEYQVIVTADPENTLREGKEGNNESQSNVIRLSDIKLLLPDDKFVFQEKGLFLFQWDSLIYTEFKIQMSTDEKFESPDQLFDLPQGDRWIADKELVPLSGELPQMALGLMKTNETDSMYWRIVGRRSDGKQTFSGVRSYTIKLENPVLKMPASQSEPQPESQQEPQK